MSLSRHQLTLEQRSPSVKNKLDSVMARLARLCSEDGIDGLQGGKHEQWAKLLE